MAAATRSPVQFLDAHIVALEAALAVCRADPKPKAVHRFRSESRRIEADLILLRSLPGLAPFRAESTRLLRGLRKLRRAAGRVRDNDVQRDLLMARIRAAAKSSAAHSTDHPLTQESIDKFLAYIESSRTAGAGEFSHLLAGNSEKLARSLEALKHALKPAIAQRVPATAFLQAADAHVNRAARIATKSKKPFALDRLSETRLHDLRKAAKLARYLAEAAPPTAHSKLAAKRFHAVQNAGGHWHDSLELTREARGVLGRKDALTLQFKADRNRHLAAFLRSLETIL